MALPTGDQPIRVVCDIRDQANAALRRDGWVASVQIPAQSIDGGELQLQVVTARITEIRVRGDAGPYASRWRRGIASCSALDPLNERDAERALLLAGDVPGLDVQLSLRPAGTQPGEVIGDLLDHLSALRDGRQRAELNSSRSWGARPAMSAASSTG